MSLPAPPIQPAPPAAGLASVLFTRTQQRVLGLLFGHPGRSYYLSEIIAAARVGRSGVQREVLRLVSSGLVSRRAIGNQLHYQANDASPIFGELASIIRKTVGLLDPLRAALDPLRDRVEIAAVFGSVARGDETASSDVDLLVVSDDLTLETLLHALQPAEQATGRRVQPMLYAPREFSRKRARNSPFLMRLLASEPVCLIGSLDATAAPGKPRPHAATEG